MASQASSVRFDPEVLRRRWIQVPTDNPSAAEEAEHFSGVDFAAAGGQAWETDSFAYLPVVVNFRLGETVARETIVFALNGDRVITLQPQSHFLVFDTAIARMRRNPQLAHSSYGVMYALLYALNEASEQVIDYASDTLESMNDTIQLATSGYDDRGKEMGVADMQDAIARMNDTEEIVSRTQESQLLLARAARHLRTEVPAEATDLGTLTDILISDIDGVKEHAGFEHDKVRYLQQSIMTSLEIKQNQIVKVFTIITAVFLPPTLIATFYGMNFTFMPELQWEHGFLATTLLTLIVALIPLVYIKRKGWLR
ncbi:CorA family divalent cation transporter [Pseudonocardia sp. ICBG162]|uniref:CorA family divalent cation transporter n=1 Tax=Pseudonocardia sp. ICBG162 TaxID=2846761 RepID=UPI001CF6D632|nr:CorA family divalent cation transporter [Pseudonocardia sp. ICBG162]